MYFVTREGIKVGYGQAFTTGDIQYPSNWLTLSKREEKDAIGLKAVSDTVSKTSFDPLWEYSDGKPLPLEVVQERRLEGLREAARKKLNPTDWYVIRAAEGIKAIPEEIKAERAAIREWCDLECAKVTSATSINELRRSDGHLG